MFIPAACTDQLLFISSIHIYHVAWVKTVCKLSSYLLLIIVPSTSLCYIILSQQRLGGLP